MLLSSSIRTSLRRVRAMMIDIKRTLLLRGRQVLFSAKIAALYQLKKKNPKRIFFVLCQHRTGSNLLISYLNSIPGCMFDSEILCGGQVYGVMPCSKSKKTVFRHIRHLMQYRRGEVWGAKFFLMHLLSFKLSLDDLLCEFPEAKWFVLYRENILDQYVSHLVARETRRWISYSKPSKKGPVFVFNLDKALIYRDKIRQWYQTLLVTRHLDRKSLWLSYEEFTLNPQKTFNERIFPFLDLPSCRISTCLVKQNTRTYAEIMTNYSEVREMIESHDFTQNYKKT